MYLAIIILPLLGSIVSGFFGRKVGVRGAQLVTCLSVIITTFMATIGFLEVGINNIPVSVLLFRWVDSESLNVLWGFNFDSLTVSMLIPVLIVSSLVHIYSIGYMSHDPHNQRFFSYLSLFTFMMIILVTANNFLLMFVGWEGVGVCSYLLVSFWFTRIAANQSSMSAFLTNRVGDCFLTLGMFAIIWTFGNLDYTTVFSLAPYISGNIVTIIGICLLIGAMAKSSQIGLHVWLPLAMEGPTPVSALIHAATMVTAGVYLLMRTSPLIEYSSTVLILCLWIGSITTVFSSLIGLFQQDIKKVIAYSTMSQLAQEFFKFRHQTICVKIITIINSQITKARDNNHIKYNLFNSFTTINIKWLHSIMFEKRKVKFISKLVGISEAIRLILVFLNLNFSCSSFQRRSRASSLNSFIFSCHTSCDCGTKTLATEGLPGKPSTCFCFTITQTNMLPYTSCCIAFAHLFKEEAEHPGQGLVNNTTADLKTLNFNEWLAGLIDGDGYFLLTKKGYVSCEICMDAGDKKALYLILHKYGGSIKSVSGAKAFKYKLRNKKGLLHLINDINGLIRNPIRLLQMNKLCNKYEILIKYPKALTYSNGWLSGFIDSDGSVYLNEKSGQIFISITQKNRFLLEPLVSLYGGRIDILSPKIEAFKFVIYRKNELFSLIDNYFSKYPLKTEKFKRVCLIKQFYDLRTYCNKNNIHDINKLNEWVSYKDKWEKFKD